MKKPMSDQPDELHLIEELAAHLTVGKCIAFRLAAEGKPPAFRLGGTWRFRRVALNKWIARRIGKPMVDDGEGAE